MFNKHGNLSSNLEELYRKNIVKKKLEIKKEEMFELEALVQNMNTGIITVSRGKAWIEIDSEKGVKLTTLNEDSVIRDHACAIQTMFNDAASTKKFNVQRVQEALNFFGWDIYLTKEDDGNISFKGSDKFLLLQISYYMGAVRNEQYAQMYRDALEQGEKVFI